MKTIPLSISVTPYFDVGPDSNPEPGLSRFLSCRCRRSVLRNAASGVQTNARSCYHFLAGNKTVAIGGSLCKLLAKFEVVLEYLAQRSFVLLLTFQLAFSQLLFIRRSQVKPLRRGWRFRGLRLWQSRFGQHHAMRFHGGRGRRPG